MSVQVESAVDNSKTEVTTVNHEKKAALLEKLRNAPPLTPYEQAMNDYWLRASCLAYDIERQYGVVLPSEVFPRGPRLA